MIFERLPNFTLLFQTIGEDVPAEEKGRRGIPVSILKSTLHNLFVMKAEIKMLFLKRKVKLQHHLF